VNYKFKTIICCLGDCHGVGWGLAGAQWMGSVGGFVSMRIEMFCGLHELSMKHNWFYVCMELRVRGDFRLGKSV